MPSGEEADSFYSFRQFLPSGEEVAYQEMLKEKEEDDDEKDAEKGEADGAGQVDPRGPEDHQEGHGGHEYVDGEQRVPGVASAHGQRGGADTTELPPLARTWGAGGAVRNTSHIVPRPHKVRIGVARLVAGFGNAVAHFPAP